MVILFFLVSFMVMSKYISIKITLAKFIVKPLISGGVMNVVALVVYKLIMTLLNLGAFGTNLIATVISIILAAIVYCVMIVVLKTLTKDEVELLPMGAKIYKLLTKLHIY